MPTNWPPSFLGLDTNMAVPASNSRAAYDAVQLVRKRRSEDQALKAPQGESDDKHSQLHRVSKLWGALRQRRSRRVSTGQTATMANAATNVSSSNQAVANATATVTITPPGNQCVYITGVDLADCQAATGTAAANAKNVRRYVVATLLVLLFGAGATLGPKAFKTAQQIYLPKVSPEERLKQLLGAGSRVWSEVSKTARQIYMRNLSPKEQLAQTNPPEEQLAQPPLPPRTSKTIPHRNQAAVNKPGEQLPNLQTTAEQTGSASQGGTLERLFAVLNKPESLGVQGDPYAKVWVDTHTGVYFCQGTVGFGKTSRGRYMTQQQARFDGFRPAYEKKCE